MLPSLRPAFFLYPPKQGPTYSRKNVLPDTDRSKILRDNRGLLLSFASQPLLLQRGNISLEIKFNKGPDLAGRSLRVANSFALLPRPRLAFLLRAAGFGRPFFRQLAKTVSLVSELLYQFLLNAYRGTHRTRTRRFR